MCPVFSSQAGHPGVSGVTVGSAFSESPAACAQAVASKGFERTITQVIFLPGGSKAEQAQHKMFVRADRESRFAQPKGFTRSKVCRGTTFQSHAPIPHLFNGEQNRHATLVKNFNRGVAWWRGFEPQCELLLTRAVSPSAKGG